MRKEPLSNDRIKLDLLERIEHDRSGKTTNVIGNLIRYAGCFNLLTLLVGGITLLFGAIAIDREHFPYVTIGSIIIAVGIIVFAIALIPTAISVKRINKASNAKRQVIESGGYRVVGDRLGRARLDAKRSYVRGDPRYSEGTDVLEFARYGSYTIPYGTNYAWSKDCYMSADGVFNTSIEGDRFYLVLAKDEHDRERIAAVYNTKLFKMQGDDPFDYE